MFHFHVILGIRRVKLRYKGVQYLNLFSLLTFIINLAVRKLAKFSIFTADSQFNDCAAQFILKGHRSQKSLEWKSNTEQDPYSRVVVVGHRITFTERLMTDTDH